MSHRIDVERFSSNDENRGLPRWASPRLPPNLLLNQHMRADLEIIRRILKTLYNIIFYCTMCEFCFVAMQITFIGTVVTILLWLI